jgi:L-lactate dehydrogenase complex protein LldG
MSEASSRETMIAGVRRAVSAWRENGPPPAAGPAPGVSPPVLVDRFVARAEAAEAFVSITSGFAGALQRIADILFELDARQVIVSDDAWEPPWDVARLSDVIEECTIRPTSSLHDTSAATIAKFAYVGVTAVAYGIADTGTLVVCSGPAAGRIESLLPPVHIALLPLSRVVASVPDVLAALERDRQFDRSSAVTFITGPSRTADIELTLTIGVHGPKQLYVILVNDLAAAAALQGNDRDLHAARPGNGG